MSLLKYGHCNIDVPVKSIPRLLIDEVLNPFYIFQFFAVAIWMKDQYALYATCILVLSILSITASLIDTLSNLKKIRKMAFYSCKIQVLRVGANSEIESTELVPGDIIEIP